MKTTMNVFDTISPLDYRYYGGDQRTFEKLSPYVSEAANIRYQLKVEAAIVKALAKEGKCPEKVAKEIQHACEKVTPEEVHEEEERIQHNIRALVNCVASKVSEEARPYVHLFATSADIMDTATALRLKELTRDVLLPDLIELELQLINMAMENAETIQMGRTHGKHAEPITFGFALALYVDRLGNRIQYIDAAGRNLRGQFSGAVGAYNALALVFPEDPAGFEQAVLRELGLKPSDGGISTQIVEPEYVTDLVYATVSCFSVLANLADDIRHLHRTEIGEVQERYDEQNVGSSTMPHKVNPKYFENVKSLWKAIMPRMITVFMDQISEHQRDLTNSASSRFVPEVFAALVYAANRLKDSLGRIQIDSQRMRDNLSMSKDSIIAEPLYILLALNGVPDAYAYTRKLVARSSSSRRALYDVIWEDERVEPILRRLQENQRKIFQDPSLYIGAAPQRTYAVCDYWEPIVDALKTQLREHL